jgi:hypothetical protein
MFPVQLVKYLVLVLAGTDGAQHCVSQRCVGGNGTFWSSRFKAMDRLGFLVLSKGVIVAAVMGMPAVTIAPLLLSRLPFCVAACRGRGGGAAFPPDWWRPYTS